ncbi:MAG: LacI family DNA-binding transcriptional regulator [Anaerolineales bacterium]|nr:LacI family DNA-binding transcriptional regulator [Anaerolineales bacterium]
MTLKQVSEIAQVSPSTVSRVINQYPNVSDDVRERVLQAVRETGYQPNPAARSLARGKSQVLGLIIPKSAASVCADPFFSYVIQGVAAACMRYDYVLSLVLFHTIEDESRTVSHILSQQLLDGVIITATQRDNQSVYQLLESGIPFVLLGQHDNDQVSYVDSDNQSGAYTAVTYLLGLGYRRIATITGPLNNLAAVQRQQGYLQALRDRDQLPEDALIAVGDFTEISGYTAMQRLLPQQPEAVFVASDTMAQGAIRAVAEAGLRVPKDIALIGYDDLPPAAQTVPPLTTIRQPIKRAGYTAVETLLDILAHGAEPPRRIILPTELVIRHSCDGVRPLNREVMA